MTPRFFLHSCPQSAPANFLEPVSLSPKKSLFKVGLLQFSVFFENSATAAWSLNTSMLQRLAFSHYGIVGIVYPFWVCVVLRCRFDTLRTYSTSTTRKFGPRDLEGSPSQLSSLSCVGVFTEALGRARPPLASSSCHGLPLPSGRIKCQARFIR